MAVKFIFEDNEKMPCCQLLLHCFQHENIFFSNGNTLLWAKTMELYNECDEIFIIMDTVPDNPRVMALYYKIYMQVRKYRNIHLIPIPCIEYIIIKMLKKYDYLEYHSNIQELIEYLIEDFQWGLISDELKRKGNLRYTERAYKYILENVKLCMHNEFNNKNHQCGKFYLEDCKCSDCKSFGNELLLKAE